MSTIEETQESTQTQTPDITQTVWLVRTVVRGLGPVNSPTHPVYIVSAENNHTTTTGENDTHPVCEVFANFTDASRRRDQLEAGVYGEVQYEVVGVELTGESNWSVNYSSQQRVIERLQTQLEAWQQQADRRLEQHEADIAHIGERLMQEASDRDWCGEYDRIVADVNRGLHVELPMRERTYRVTGTVTVTVTVDVDASDSDSAESQWRDHVDTQDIISCVRNGRYEYDYDSTDAELA